MSSGRDEEAGRRRELTEVVSLQSRRPLERHSLLGPIWSEDPQSTLRVSHDDLLSLGTPGCSGVAALETHRLGLGVDVEQRERGGLKDEDKRR